jgi:hypothetical protein
MGDKYCVNIQIGGEITTDQISELWVLVLRSMVGWDWGDYYRAHQVEQFVENINDAAQTIDSFWLYDAEGNHTSFEEIAAFCRKAGLSYLIHEDPYADYAEEYKWWVPGLKPEEQRTVLAVSGKPAITIDTLLEHLHAYVGQVGICVEMLGQLIEHHKPPDIPALTIKE